MTRVDRAGGRAFAVAMTATLLVLALAAGVFVALGVLRGPALAGVQVNLRAAQASAGQRMVLGSDQALDEGSPPDVAVDPAVPVTVSVQGTSVTVQLDAPLAYATDYTISVRGVVSALGSSSSDWSHRFTTPDITGLYALRHGPDGDAVVAATAAPGDPEVVYRGDDIVAFAATTAALAVVQRDPATDLDTVTVVPRQGGDPTVVAFPAAGRVTSIRGALDGSMFGLTYTQPQTAFTTGGTDLLFTYDLGRGGGLPELVPGADGEQISAVDWRFVPGSAQLLAITPAGRLLRVDAVDAFTGAAVAVDLGGAGAFRGTVASSSGVVVDDAGSLSLVTGDAVIPQPWADGGPGSVVVDGQGSALVVGADGASLDLLDAGGTRTAVLAGGADGITSVCTSPNGLYAAVTSGAATTVVSLRGAGELADVLTTVEGTSPSWC